MATLTIRSIPDEVVDRIKFVAGKARRSMEQEVRQLLEERYASRQAVLQRIEERWASQPKATAAEIDAWIIEGRE